MAGRGPLGCADGGGQGPGLPCFRGKVGMEARLPATGRYRAEVAFVGARRGVRTAESQAAGVEFPQTCQSTPSPSAREAQAKPPPYSLCVGSLDSSTFSLHFFVHFLSYFYLGAFVFSSPSSWVCLVASVHLPEEGSDVKHG